MTFQDEVRARLREANGVARDMMRDGEILHEPQYRAADTKRRLGPTATTNPAEFAARVTRILKAYPG